MRIFQRIGVMLLAAVPCCAWAQLMDGGGPARPVVQYGGSISGHVYCADTNAPARFARVTLMAAGTSKVFSEPRAVTGLDGSFVMPNVAPGSYYVSASITGYVDPLSRVLFADVASSDAAAQARVASVLTVVRISGNEPAHVELRLERGASVSGTVYYDDGSPAINVRINAKPMTSTGTIAATVDASLATRMAEIQQRTDDYGRYRITGLPSGEYVVSAISPFSTGGFGRGRQLNEMTMYAPKSFSVAEAKSYTLKAGSEVNGVDILIPLAAFHTVSGTAESSDGHTLNAGSLTLVSTKDKMLSFRGSLHSDGQFRIDFVPEGSYTLTLNGGAVTEPSNGGRGRAASQIYGSVTQSVMVQSGDVSNVVLQVQAAQSAASH